ncbi:GNAT family N-acetyltransferase [Butyrivibrio sp. NC3005]|uniref:GNAT family N-acetyltransferase n=1 Tax=Butyrivibrio sp. NC3005 TaxID=1280685 RepID=UPI00068764AF|nr:GNAT family N-acetyltransferase [Butyrivibrio sp. NC3005]
MSMNLKKATINDARDILDWRNDKDTRENSFSNEIIDYESHIKWFEKKLSDNNCRMFILIDNNEKIGQIRVDINNKIGEISYMISPKYRGKGYGSKIVDLIEKELIGEVKVLTALVKSTNKSSQKIFLKNEYVEFDGQTVKSYIKII